MKLFLVRLRRLTTDTILSIHVEAKNYLDALRFARNQMSDKHNWVTISHTECNCPNQKPTITHMGVKVWLEHNFETGDKNFHVLFSGCDESFILDTDVSTIREVKAVIEDLLLETY